jgi:hypothetical protein
MKSFVQYLNEDNDFTLEKGGVVEVMDKNLPWYNVMVNGEKIATVYPYKSSLESRSTGKRYVNSRKDVVRWEVKHFYKNGKSVSTYKNGKHIMFSSYMKYKNKEEAAKSAVRDYSHIGEK